MKPIRLTAHARERCLQREIKLSWIETATRDPQWVVADAADRMSQRRFRAIAERDGRILRVVCVETDDEIRVMTLMFDRNARKP